MSKISRLFNAFESIVMIAIGIILLILPIDVSYLVVAIIIGVIITFKALKNMVFYFASARHMVGGGRIFINSFILLDFGLLSFFVLLQSSFIATMYLVGVFVILGVIDILRAVEIKKSEGKRWVLKLTKGILIVILGILCFVFIRSNIVLPLIFGISWIVLGVQSFIASFRSGSVQYFEFDTLIE